MFHPPFAKWPPQRDVAVVFRADETDHPNVRRHQRTDTGKRVGAFGINGVNFQARAAER